MQNWMKKNKAEVKKPVKKTLQQSKQQEGTSENSEGRAWRQLEKTKD